MEWLKTFNELTGIKNPTIMILQIRLHFLIFLLFADDTTILYSSSNIVSKIPMIDRELSEVSNWFKANKLSVNAIKTNYMIMGTQHMTSKIKVQAM